MLATHKPRPHAGDAACPRAMRKTLMGIRGTARVAKDIAHTQHYWVMHVEGYRFCSVCKKRKR